MRKITYAQAINEAFHQLMASDENVILIGQGVTSPWYVGSTADGLIDKFSEKRVIDTPISENGITGIAAGASLYGIKPIIVHPRMDFMYYAMDQIANHIANWYYMFGGQFSMPLIIWGIINRGGEQAAQHSQAIHALFMHIPGLKVIAPSTAYDVKGLLIAACKDKNPVLFIDDRWLYQTTDFVPKKMYNIPIGKAKIRKKGKDITIVSSSYMSTEVLKAAFILEEKAISAEVIDLRSLKPIDKNTIFSSVKKTKRLVIVDGGWKTCGAASEISAIVAEQMLKELTTPIKRITLPDLPAPASCNLEKKYYNDSNTIAKEIQNIMEG